MALEDVIEKLIQFKIMMMMLESLGGATGVDITEIENKIDEAAQEILGRLDEVEQGIIGWMSSKFGGANLKIRELYAIKVVPGFGIEDLVKKVVYRVARPQFTIEDLTAKTVIYPTLFTYSIEEVNEGAST